MIAQKIAEGIYWVGVIDWGLRSFHGYLTPLGTTYNAYLILDEKITLIDNVKEPFTEEMLARISSVIDPRKIEVIISNHGEPDHSGSLIKVLTLAKQAKVYSASGNGVKILKAQYGDNLPIVGVENGKSLSIGKRTLEFYHAPMVHWPDNMVTYLPEDKILFSNDIFGQHLASSERFDDELDLNVALREAKKYYANIVLPYTKQAFKFAEMASGLDIKIIATSHGIIWRSHIPEILDLYQQMTTSRKKKKAIVVYDTMWGSTEAIAQQITETFIENSIPVVMYNINDTDDSDIITELMEAQYLAVGSPTFNNNILPRLASFLTYLKGLRPVGIKYIAFGSYGWGGQSIQIIDDLLASLNFTRLVPPIKLHYRPKNNDFQKIKNSISQSLSQEV